MHLLNYSLFFIVLMMSSCTVSINLANTHGTAEDVVDSKAETDTSANADLKIPAIGL